MKLSMIIIICVCAIIAALAGYYLMPSPKLPSGTIVDNLVVYKSKRKMEVYSGDRLVKTYVIALGRSPVGHKEYEGDCKTPEGVYKINDRNPNSAYHKNLGISYPNEQDVAHARTIGKDPGGHIKIHGLRNDRGYIGKFHRWKNWTAGCIAVTNEEVDELYAAVKKDAVITIRP